MRLSLSREQLIEADIFAGETNVTAIITSVMEQDGGEDYLVTKNGK